MKGREGRQRSGRGILKQIVGTFTLVMLGSMVAGAAHATTYEVSPGGNDSNPGTAAQPWKTLQHAALEVGPGDTVLVNDGTYAGFRMRTSGNAGARIVFKSKNKWGAKVTTPDPNNDVDLINIFSASYVTIDGFEVSGAPRAGIGVRSFFDDDGADTRDNIVQNCYSHHNGLPSGGAHDGIFSGFALNLTVQDNICDGNGEHGIYISNSADNPIVRRNTCSNNRASGIQLNADQHTGNGEQDGLISNWLVESNIIFGNGTSGGAGINLDGDINGVCRNNLIYNNLASGIALYGIDGAQASNNNLIVNNTIYNPNSNRGAILLADGANNNTVFNNICYSGKGFDVESVTGFVHDYNLVSSYVGATASAHESSPAVSSIFQNLAGNDFRLAAASPALNTGVATFGGKNAPTVDLLQNARPAGPAFDRGAYETPDESGAPAIAVTAPANGARIMTLPAISGIATDDGGVTKVVFYLKRNADSKFWTGTGWGTTTALTTTLGGTPTNHTWTRESGLPAGADLPYGSYTVTAWAFDNAGNKTSVISGFLRNETELPTVAITAPAHKAVLKNGLTSITGTAADTGGSGINRVVLYLRRISDSKYWNGTAWGGAFALSTNLNGGQWSKTTGLPSGANLQLGVYALTAYAIDFANNRRSVVQSFSIAEGVAPTVAITAPANGSTVSTLTQVSGTAGDTGGSGLSRVAFYLRRLSDSTYWNGTAWVATVVELPSTITGGTWKSTALPTGVNLVDGLYQARAIAVDGSFNTSPQAISQFTLKRTGSSEPSAVTLSTIRAGSDGTVELVFTGAVNEAAGSFRVQQGGAVVEVTGVQQASPNTVRLTSEGLSVGARVTVTYDVQDSAGRTVQGEASVLVR